MYDTYVSVKLNALMAAGFRKSARISVKIEYGLACTEWVEMITATSPIPMKARCNSTPESSCMGNIRTLEPDFEYISTQKYQVLAMIFGYYFYACTR